MKLFLHIGTEKTGSTSFQRWGALNRQKLAANGVCYSQSLGAENHRKLYLWSLPPDIEDDGYAHAGLASPTSRAILRDTMPAQLAHEIEAAQNRGNHSFLVSSEHCHSRLTDIESVQRLYDLLNMHFDEIEVICSLRPQIDVAISLGSTWARGLPIDRNFFDNVVPENPYYDYLGLYERWVRVFGAESVTLVPYRSSPDMATYILERLNIPADEMKVPTRQNEALDIRVIALANAIHHSRNGKAGTGFDSVLQHLACNEKLQPGLERAQTIQRLFTERNTALTQANHDITVEDLDPNWERYNKAPNLYLLDQPCAFSNQLVEMLTVYQLEVVFAQARELAANAERAIARNNPESARDYLSQARRKMAQSPVEIRNPRSYGTNRKAVCINYRAARTCDMKQVTGD